MKTLLRIAVSVALAAGAARADQPVLTIATGEYPPHTGAELEGYGTASQVVTAVLEEAGFRAEYSFLPWKRALEEARQGRYPATSWWAFSEERTGDFIHVGPVLESPIVFFRMKDTEAPDWTELPDLAGMRIGAVPGYTYTAEFWELAEDGTLDVHLAPSDEANIRKLLAGRIDLYPIGRAVGWSLLEKILPEAERERITTLEQPLALTLGYVLISRQTDDAEDLAERLQTAIDRLRKEGRVLAQREDEPG